MNSASVNPFTEPEARTLAAGIGFTEGPVWTPEGRLFVTSVSRGTLFEVFLDGRPAVPVVETGGGPNGMTIAPDGTLWITQNGGGAMPSRSLISRPPSLQRWNPAQRDRRTETIAVGDLIAPSDCAFGADGCVWFSDPDGHDFGADARPGRVLRFDPRRGRCATVLDDVYFPNGIAFGPDDDRLYVAETARDRVCGYVVSKGTVVHEPAVIFRVATPDGIAADVSGGIWVAGSRSGLVTRFDRTGRVRSVLQIGERSMPTSVAFAGPDLSTLVVTVAKGGRVLAFDAATPGTPVPPDRRLS